MASKDIQLIISAKDETQKTFNSIKGNLESHSADFKKMAMAGTVAFGAIVGAVGLSVKAYAESEERLARVDTAIKNIDLDKMGTDFGTASKKARDFGSSLQSVAGISDELGAESFAKLLAVTKDYDEATKLATLSADLSVAKQISMESATKMITMALSGNVKLLKEYGIELEDGASKQEIIGAVMEKVGGQAEAFGNTIAGKTAIIKQSFGDMQESIGVAFLPVIEALTDKLLPLIQNIQKWAGENPKLIATIVGVGLAISGLLVIVGGVGLVIPAMIGGLATLGVTFGSLIGIVAIVVGAIAGLILIGRAVIDNWDTIANHPAVKVLWDTLKTSIDNVVLVFQENLMPALQKLWDALQPLKPFLEVFVKIIGIFLVGALMLAIKLIEIGLIVALGIMQKGIELAIGVVNFFKKGWEEWIDVLSRVIGWIDKTIAKINELNFIKNAGNAISGAISSVFGGGKAVGGYVSSNKAYLVGEQGPELFSPSISGSIIPNNKLGGNGGVGIVVNITGNTIQTADDITELVDRGIKNALRLNNQLSY